MIPLPIDPLLPELAARLAESPALVLEAPPGAGKTTRVPHVLLGWAGLKSAEALVLEPRRLAARLAARRVAEELGELPGERIGWQIRFEDVSSPRTRVRFVTEGVLTRRLLSNPGLNGVSAVVFDEFHERHLHADVGLALVRRLQLGARPDLRCVVMSATLDAAPVRDYLGGAPLLRAEGRRFDVELIHSEKHDDRRLQDQVAGALKRLLLAGLAGDVLVFLPGAGEIARAMEACAPIAESNGLDVVPLHGELPPEAQDRAVRRGPRRKVILSTNVAETSVTIDGVEAVIDSGLARVAGHSPWTGLPTLRVQKVSRASATQRAGRAGRTGPGKCIRLYTQSDFASRPAHDEPEIRRSDLAQTVLEVAASGARISELPFFEPPPASSVDAAESLLRRLGALDRDGALTPTGRKMVELPVHPRLARLVLEGDRLGAGREAAALSALLGERDVRESGLFRGDRRGAGATSDSDPLDVLDLFLAARARGLAPDALRSHGLAPAPTRSADKTRGVLERAVRPGPTRLGREKTDEALRRALLAAFPDRVAKRRGSGGELVFAAGGSGTVGEASAVRNAEWVVAVDVEERRADASGRGGGVQVRSASAIEPDWLLDLGDAVEERTETLWNERLSRVEATTKLTYGALVLDESATVADPAAVAERLFLEARALGPRAWDPEGAADRLRRRLEFAARAFPESGVKSLASDDLEAALRAMCEGRRSFSELREASLVEALLARAGTSEHELARLAPESVVLPGGRRTKVEYEPGQPPAVSSRLQDFFGMAKGPSVRERVPLVLHLLAPNGRDVQVTTDLAGFWARHYPALRKELMRRYPRHSWPEDPTTAAPPAPKPGWR
jgi:ATP-dependent helicase HrpB